MELKTSYLGLTLKNPIVVSPAPISKTLDGIKRLADAGAGAIVMQSLFEEQITEESLRLDQFLSYCTNTYGEALSYFPDLEDYNSGPDRYLERIRLAKEYTDIPIIGSLNGVSTGGWIKYAQKFEEAGADALELNIYYIPTDPAMTGDDVEAMYFEVVSNVKSSIDIPVAVKVSPYFSSTANIASQLVDAGADGLVLFNRFFQPDLDLEALEVVPHLVLSTPDNLRLPLRWVAILYGRIQTDFAITSGVHDHICVLQSMMAGAKVAMMASVLLMKGPEYITEVLENLKLWMEEHEYESIEQMQGSMSQQYVAEPAAFERANYMKVLESWRPPATL
jgi:dihydroorotate dehydrogenase (fumarate)